MIPETEYIRLLGELLNQDADPKERERRVREANRELFQVVVAKRVSSTRADLALAKAALQGDQHAQ